MNQFPDVKTNAAALAAFLFLAALAWVSVALAVPPRAVPEGAPASEFSSARALRHVRAIAQKPHPTGSEEIERVRRYILGELAALGVVAEVQAVEVVPRQASAGWPVLAARVQNIVARVPGTAGGRALMLAAHYDSVPTGPGASDDGAGVATLLETLRALKSGPPLKNDLILVFTDAEELGLVGARGFADEHPWMRDVGLVLNFEARGAGGPSLMFETSEGNGTLIRGLAAAAPHAVANSLMYAVYKRLPNDTDMTVFKRASAAGLNFAYADRITSYHTALDSADELDERSLQHHGSYALALARRFGDLDLGNLKSRDAVYFNALGPVFVHYSESWVVPLTLLVCLLFALACFAFLLTSGKGSFESAKGLTLAALAAAPGVVICAPLVWMFFFMLGLDLGGFFMLLVVLLCGLLVPHFRALTARRRWLVPAAAALAGLCFVAAGLARASFDARHRKTDSVFYLLDADAVRARFVSTDAAPDEWTSQFVPAGAGKESLAAVFPWMPQQARGAEAPAAALPAPDVQVLEDRAEGDVRTLRLRLASARRAPMLLFYVEPGADVRRASLDGRALLDEASRATGDSKNGLRVSFAAPPPEGLELLLETRAAAPVRLVVEDLSFGLPEVPGQLFRPRP